MNVKVKSFNIRAFEQTTEEGGEKKKVDKSVMTYEEMIEKKTKIAELLGIDRIHVTAHFEGIE